MLALAVQIGLTVAAWRRGWKGWALVPLVSELLFGFLLGLLIGVSGGSVQDVWPLGVLLDLAVIGVLGAVVAAS